MKCVLLLLSLVALCYSVPVITGRKRIEVDENGTIIITGSSGRKVVISRNTDEVGKTNIKVSVEGPFGSEKSFQVEEDEENLRKIHFPDLLDILSAVTGESQVQERQQSSARNIFKEPSTGRTEEEEIFGQAQEIIDESLESILRDINKHFQSQDLEDIIGALQKESERSQSQARDIFKPVSNVASGVRERLALLQDLLNTETTQQKGEIEEREDVRQHRKPQVLTFTRVSPFLLGGVPSTFERRIQLPLREEDKQVIQEIRDALEDILEQNEQVSRIGAITLQTKQHPLSRQPLVGTDLQLTEAEQEYLESIQQLTHPHEQLIHPLQQTTHRLPIQQRQQWKQQQQQISPLKSHLYQLARQRQEPSRQFQSSDVNPSQY